MKEKLKYIIPLILLFALFTYGVMYFVEHQEISDVPIEYEVISDSVEVVEPIYLYGLNTDSFQVYSNIVERNQNLSDILLNYGLEYRQIHQLANQSKPIFDVRRIRFGNNYTMFCAKDSLGKVQVMVYEIDNTDYVIYDFRDTLKVERLTKEIRIERKTASGTIESSLYKTMVDNAISQLVAIELSDVFAWEIDFYYLQKGDQFKVIYNEKFVDDKSIGVKDIEAAYFYHYGNEYYGIYFEQDSVGDYFDEKGNSLRKAFLKSPLKYGRLTSNFSYKRFHPVQKRFKAHLGTDYAAPRGTPILATGAGTVIESGHSNYNGNYVKIKHNGTYTTQYLHMSKRAVSKGARVKQGQIIGYVGSTGLATGPHVCYRFWKNGQQINHKNEKMPPSKPVNPEHKERYDSVKAVYLEQLKQIKF